jgi:signal transduction histidine kinase
VVIIVVSLALRGESLKVEKELQLYKSHMDELVEARVRELDEAHARLAAEEQGRRATEEVLRRRVEELNALQRIAQILGGRSTLERALEEVADAIVPLFGARYARVLLTAVDRDETDGVASTAPAGGDVHPGLDREAAALALHEQAVIDEELETWPELTAETRRRAAEEGIGAVLAMPLLTTSGLAGALIVARDAPAGRLSPDERRLARTIAEALAAVVEIDRLHRAETRQAAAEERQALARDLHDAVTQSIYSASLIAEALPAVFERDPEEGLRNLERLQRLVRAALAELRTLLFELRPQALETASLETLIERLGDALAGQADIEVEVHADEDPALPADVKVALYRVTQESFSNIAKHARASAVSARLTDDAGAGVTLTINDDGRGFDPHTVQSDHLGLRIMGERLERVGGSFTVESSPGGGTTITALWRRPASDRAARETIGA